MNYLILILTLFIIGCAPPHAIHEMIVVYSAWQDKPETTQTMPEERLEGNYKAWGE